MQVERAQFMDFNVNHNLLPQSRPPKDKNNLIMEQIHYYDL